MGVSRGSGLQQSLKAATSTELVHSARDGDRDAWFEIVRRFEGLVWSVALSCSMRDADAADVSQTVWLRLAQHLSRLHNPEDIKSWLATTTRHECYRVAKQQARTVPVDVTDYLAEVPAPFDSTTRLEVVERNHALWEAFLRLPNTCQALLKLLNADPPPTYVDVADRCGIAIGSIGSRRQRCLWSLRVALQNNSAIGKT